ncbi:hypothetical protein WBJ53_06465 [Spirosoma sp. SC4-14]|uniref:hypothetical protein n=1 Tax=Spirosoma sp. SC4-14 TaxID=3128900 RepID=UPI0030D1FCCE
MRKIVVLFLVLISILVLIGYFMTILEGSMDNPIRIISQSSQEAKEHDVLLGRYELISQNLFFHIKEAWVEQSILYKNDKKEKVNKKSQTFVIVVSFMGKADKEKDYSFEQLHATLLNKDTTNEYSKFAGYIRIKELYMTFTQKAFGDSITIQVQPEISDKEVSRLIFKKRK